jgi:hypothetical protein
MKEYIIYTGLVNKWFLDTTFEKLYHNYNVKYYTETYKKCFGLIQVSIGKKHSLNKIIVNLKKDSYSRYTLIKNGKKVGNSSDFISALKYFK